MQQNAGSLDAEEIIDSASIVVIQNDLRQKLHVVRVPQVRPFPPLETLDGEALACNPPPLTSLFC